MSSLVTQSQQLAATHRSVRGRTTLTVEERKALEGAEKRAIELMEEDKMFWEKQKDVIRDLVIHIVAKAIENGDHIEALDDWRKCYHQVLNNANGTLWSLDLIENQLENMLHYVEKHNQVTEEYEWMPVQNMLRMRRTFRVQRRFLPLHQNWPTAAWWHYELRKRIEELAEQLAESEGISLEVDGSKPYDARINLIKDYREDLKGLLGIGKDVKPTAQSRLFWLERDLELKILELLSGEISERGKKRFSLLNGWDVQPLYQLANIRNRLESMRVPTRLLSWSAEHIGIQRFEAEKRAQEEHAGALVLYRPSSSRSH
ncbi:hypothetical protein JCM3765_005580 [Sporobolomyces pararoseus]